MSSIGSRILELALTSHQRMRVFFPGLLPIDSANGGHTQARPGQARPDTHADQSPAAPRPFEKPLFKERRRRRASQKETFLLTLSLSVAFRPPPGLVGRLRLRLRARAEAQPQAEEGQDQLHGGADGDLGAILREDAIPGRLHARRDRPEDEIDRGQGASVVQQQEGQVAEVVELRLGGGRGSAAQFQRGRGGLLRASVVQLRGHASVGRLLSSVSVGGERLSRYDHR